MFCSQCGKKLNDDAKFCSSCGTKIVTGNIKVEQKAYNKADIKNKCQFCGEILSDGEIKCPSCGNERRETRPVNFNKSSDEKINLGRGRSDSHENSNIYEKTEKLSKFVLKFGEKIILKDNGFIYNQDEEFEHVLILTNQSLYIIVDDEEEVFDDILRVPLSQINQCIFHNGGFLGENYLEIFRMDSTDRVDLSFGRKNKLILWNMAINDRFKEETANRGYEYYKNINLKKLK